MTVIFVSHFLFVFSSTLVIAYVWYILYNPTKDYPGTGVKSYVIY